MSNRPIEILDNCCKLLSEYQTILTDALRKGNQQCDPQAVMILRTFDFGLRTGQSMKLLIKADATNALFACTLCRAFFEAAVRMLWASRTLPNNTNPWECLQKHWATVDLKWTDEAKGFPELVEYAETIRQCRQEILDRTDGKRMSLSIPKCLYDIQQADVMENLREAGKQDAEFAYTNVYRLFCRPAHGHIVEIGNQNTDSSLTLAYNGFARATSWLLQACCHIVVEDTKAEIERIVKLITGILKRNHD